MITTPIWWAFLLVSPILYWVAPQRLRAGLLALLSFTLLMTFAPIDIGLMALLATFVYLSHSVPQEKTGFQATIARLGKSPWPIAVVLAYFVWSKYLPALLDALGHKASFFDLFLPLGISYFTFKLLHYSLERRRGTLPAHGFADFAAFMFLAPIFTAGPIERFDHFLKHREATFHWDFVAEGLVRIAQGIVKKFFLAVLVFKVLEKVAGTDYELLLADIGGTPAWKIWVFLFLALAYSYLDFAAYSDIAIGSSRLFGLTIAENFNMPFLAMSLREFWQRWHMTLASWVLTYVYMPLVGQTRNPYWSIILTFAVVGIWHAAWPVHWILWGVWHGVGLAILIWWTQLFRKRRSKALQQPVMRAAGWALTMFYAAASEAFATLAGMAPISDSFRLLGASLGLI
ncbi:MAG: MBOAT family protein [Rhodobacteraceae bacterium]|nr:MBOAT family protein [Paracoccaceae bacterium]